MRRVAVVGYGNTPFKRRYIDKTYPRLAYEAVRQAFDSTGVGPEQVDSVVYGIYSDMFNHNMMPDLHIHYQLGLARKPSTRVSAGGATGGIAVRTAFMEIASGMKDIVMVVGVEKYGDLSNVFEMIKALTYGGDQLFEQMAGVSPAGSYSAPAILHMLKYGTTEEQLALVSVKNHTNALRNPDAQAPMDITVEDVMSSPMIIYPYKLLDHCLNSEGACALLLADEESALRMTDNPVWIEGIGCSTESGRQAERDDVGESLMPAVEAAAQEAYDMAGVKEPARDIHVAEVYDSFTGIEILLYEELGFCARGEGAARLEKGSYSMEGELPVNPSGGLIGGEHAVGATGVYQVAEIARQLRGEAGERQVEGAGRGLALCLGGARGAYASATVLEVQGND
jgi:acetyl-CoA C-acetyltransferase